MRLKILTPEKIVWDGDVESVLVPGEDGFFEVLKGHAPILSSLAPGNMRIVTAKKEQFFHISHGFLEFSHDQGVLLADSVEKPGEIDRERVRLAKERAEKRLKQTEDVDISRAEKALARALSRERFIEKFPG